MSNYIYKSDDIRKMAEKKRTEIEDLDQKYENSLPEDLLFGCKIEEDEEEDYLADPHRVKIQYLGHIVECERCYLATEGVYGTPTPAVSVIRYGWPGADNFGDMPWRCFFLTDKVPETTEELDDMMHDSRVLWFPSGKEFVEYADEYKTIAERIRWATNKEDAEYHSQYLCKLALLTKPWFDVEGGDPDDLVHAAACILGVDIDKPMAERVKANQSRKTTPVILPAKYFGNSDDNAAYQKMLAVANAYISETYKDMAETRSIPRTIQHLRETMNEKNVEYNDHSVWLHAHEDENDELDATTPEIEEEYHNRWKMRSECQEIIWACKALIEECMQMLKTICNNMTEEN